MLRLFVEQWFGIAFEFSQQGQMALRMPGIFFKLRNFGAGFWAPGALQ
jgi:hypothetical protein